MNACRFVTLYFVPLFGALSLAGEDPIEPRSRQALKQLRDKTYAHLSIRSGDESVPITRDRLHECNEMALSGMLFWEENCLPWLKDMDHLEYLSIDDGRYGFGIVQTGRTRLSDSTISHIGALHNLKGLRLSSFDVREEALIAQLRKLEKLESIEICSDANTVLGDSLLEALSDLPHLKQIRLHGCPSVTSRGIRCLERLPNLQILDVVSRNVDDDAFSEMHGFSEMRELYLRGAQISDKGAACFAKLPNLEVLRLTDSRITDKSLEVIGRLRKLRYLVLSGSNIRGPGLVHLTSLRHLEWLCLMETRVSGQSLVVLKDLPRLKVLGLERTGIPSKTIDDLQKEEFKSVTICRDKAL